MELILWKNFSKKINSTKQPEDSSGATMQVYLKQGTSLEDPTFMINGIELEYNYCKWADHYYFIDDISVGNNNIYEIRCKMDVLATWKNAIGASEQYIDRAGNSDTWSIGSLLADSFYPTLPNPSRGYTQPPHAPNFSFRTDTTGYTSYCGVYVLAILSDGRRQDTNNYFSRGGIDYYVLNYLDAIKVLVRLQSLSRTQTEINPLDYIRSFTYIPAEVYSSMAADSAKHTYNFTSTITMDIPLSPIQIGNDPIDHNTFDHGIYTLYGLYKPAIGETSKSYDRFTFDIQNHPQSDNGRRDYLNYAPFSAYTLQTGAFGDFEIATNLLSGDSYRRGWLCVVIDLATGESYIEVSASSNYSHTSAIVRKEANISVPLALSNAMSIGAEIAKKKFELAQTAGITNAAIGAVSGIASAGVGVATGNPLVAAGGIVNAGAGVLNTAVSLQSQYYDYTMSQLPSPRYVGGNGSFADFTIPFTVVSMYRLITSNTDDEKYGRPVGATYRLDTIPGYIKCHTFTAEIPCHYSEYAEIEAYAVAGFYFE